MKKKLSNLIDRMIFVFAAIACGLGIWVTVSGIKECDKDAKIDKIVKVEGIIKTYEQEEDYRRYVGEMITGYLELEGYECRFMVLDSAMPRWRYFEKADKESKKCEIWIYPDELDNVHKNVDIEIEQLRIEDYQYLDWDETKKQNKEYRNFFIILTVILSAFQLVFIYVIVKPNKDEEDL